MTVFPYSRDVAAVNMHLGGRCSRSGGVMLLAVVLLAAAANVSAFYLPGVAPTDYSLGDKMQVKVSRTNFGARALLAGHPLRG